MKKNGTGAAQTGTEQKAEKNMESLQSSALAIEKENNSNSSKIMDVLKVRHTPFSIVTTGIENAEKCFITVGNKRVSEMITKELAETKIKYKDWDLLSSLIVIITENVVEQMKLEDKARNELPIASF